MHPIACCAMLVDNSLSLSIDSVAMLLCIKSCASMHEYLLMHCVIVYEYLMALRVLSVLL